MRAVKPRLTLVLAAVLAASGCRSTPGGEPEESYVEVGDGKLLHYRKIGAGTEVLIVPEASWVEDDMQRLARGRTVVFYDPRGRGRSDPALSFRFDEDLADLEKVRLWFGFEHFSLLGTQAGATLAAMYAATHPDRVERLVLVSPPPIAREPYWKIYERVFDDRRSKEAFRKLAQLKLELVNRHDPERWAEAYKDALFTGWVVDARSIRRMKSNPFVEPNEDPERQVTKYLGMFRELGDWDWRQDLVRVRCPTLLVFGSEDPVPRRSFEEWAAATRARVHVVEGAGRLPWIEKPGSFYGAVEEFLELDELNAP